MAVSSNDGSEKQELNEIVGQDNLDFEAWTRLISTVELMYKDDIDKISMAYDSFLSEYPLCYGYWKKYAEHKARLCDVDKVVQIFERATESAPYSVGVWLDYCSFSITSFEDPLDICRLFERGLSFVGKDYLSHKLWDKYIEFEYSQQHWNSLANIYIRILKFPTKRLHQYHESFKKLVAIWEEDMEFGDRSLQHKHEVDAENMVVEDAQMSHLISDLLDASTRSEALLKYISTGEEFYRRACEIEAKVQKFEQNIRRPYFHAKPLDENQLQTWHQYLDFVELEGDFDWAVKLYERCLISCAHYPEFWMRYVDYLESKGGSELANDAMDRATQIFLKNAPEIHLFSAWFKEKAGDIDGAYAAFLMCDQDFGYHFMDTVVRKANMEKRLGNYARASSVYKDALKIAAKKSPDTLPMLYVHYARLQYAITSSLEAARTVLLNGIQRVPHSILLLKELIRLISMDDGAKQLDILDSVIAKALTLDFPGALSVKDREEISTLYLQLVDSCGSIHDIRRAWNRHLKLFPRSVRVQSSLKKSAKAGDILKMIAEGAESINTRSQKTSVDLDKNQLTQLPQPEETLIVEENVDKSEQATHLLTHSGDGGMSQDGLELVPAESTKSSRKDKGVSNELDVETAYKTAHAHYEADYPNGTQIDQGHLSQKEKLLSQSGFSSGPRDNEVEVSVLRGVEAPREASLSNGSTPTGGHDLEEKVSISTATNKLENSAAETCNESRNPSSAQEQKDYLPALSPDHPSDREGNQLRRNSCVRARSEYGSARNSGERLERSLSPRRRGPHGYFDDKRHRERSLSPRRQGSRWRSDEHWHRDRRHRRHSRYQDNSRGHRDGRMQNQSIVLTGNNGLPHNGQQQGVGSASQNKLPVQSVAYPQAPINQYPLPSNELYGNMHGSQVYNQMWAHYYQQQQQLLQQPTCQQQQPQQIPPQPQLLQQMQSPMQQHTAIHQQSPLTVLNQQQLLLLQYQQQHMVQQPLSQQQTNEQTQSEPQKQLQQLHFFQQLRSQQHDQQQQISEQTQSQLQQAVQQQLQVPQQQSYQNLQLVQQQQQAQIQQQPQPQPQLQQQQEAYLQQQQQSYQYQQQYLLYLQQLHQFQQSQQQSGLVQDQKPFLKQLESPEKQQDQGKFAEVQNSNVITQSQQDDGSLQVDSVGTLGSHHHQDPGVEQIHASTSEAAAELQSQNELPEIEGTDM